MRKTLLAAVTLGVVSATSAFSSTVTYVATSHTEGNPSHPEHSVWFQSSPSGASGSQSNHFLFENSPSGVGSFVVNGMNATLTGQVVNAGGQIYDLALHLVETADPNAYKNPFGEDTNLWTFYDLDPNSASTLTSLSGLSSFDISLRGQVNGNDLKAQFGLGANDKNAGLLGLSTWIGFTESNCELECEYHHGDINILLEPVPVPASAALLPLGIAVMGALRARRRRKS
ncbi:MAG: PEP-CTERM sorting domain-containing protein [Pseudomonadota bacterium]